MSFVTIPEVTAIIIPTMMHGACGATIIRYIIHQITASSKGQLPGAWDRQCEIAKLKSHFKHNLLLFKRVFRHRFPKLRLWSKIGKMIYTEHCHKLSFFVMSFDLDSSLNAQDFSVEMTKAQFVTVQSIVSRQWWLQPIKLGTSQTSQRWWQWQYFC